MLQEKNRVSSCEVCQRIEKIEMQENPCFVVELETGYVVLGDFQRFPGYSVFLCKYHVKEVYLLEKSIRLLHMYEMSVVAEAIEKVFAADKMNYESLGNGIAHLHWHLYPRRKGDMPEKGPVWWLGKEKLYDEKYKITDEFIVKYRDALKAEILALI